MHWPTLPPPLRPRSKRRQRHYEGVLGTSLELQLLADGEAQLEIAQTLLLAEIDRLERILSRFLPDSELNRFQARRGRRVTLSPELAAVLAQAGRFMTLTGGAFHPAADALSTLWARGEPDEKTLSGVLAQMAQPLWTLEGRQAALHTSLSLNFNAHAKGFIADAAARAAFSVPGVREVMLNLGGDLCHLGRQSVLVGVEAPGSRSDSAAPAALVRLRGQALASSGSSHRGQHLIDPRSGWRVSSQRAASVLADTCAEADALATAFCVLSSAESLHLADALGVGVLIFAEDKTHSNAVWQQAQTSSTLAATS